MEGGVQLIRRIAARVILHGGSRGCQCIERTNGTIEPGLWRDRRERFGHSLKTGTSLALRQGIRGRPAIWNLVGGTAASV